METLLAKAINIALQAQKDEVDLIKLSSPRELINLINSSSNSNSAYLAAITKAMKERGLIQ